MKFPLNLGETTKFDSSLAQDAAGIPNSKLLFGQLRQFHDEGQLIEILYFLPNLKEINFFPPVIHMIVGISLFRSGFATEGIKEVSIAIETESDRQIRRDYISLIGVMFANLGKINEAMTFLGYCIDYERSLGKDFNDLKKTVTLFLDEIMKFDSSEEYVLYKVFVVLNFLLTENRVIPNFPSLENQIVQFKKANKTFKTGTFANDCFQIVDIISDVNDLLKNWKNNKKRVDQSTSNVISLLSKAILILGPQEIYQSMLDIEPLIQEHIEAIGQPTQPKISLFKKRSEHVEIKIAQRKLVHGFLYMLKNDYSRAIPAFSKIIEILDPLDDPICDKVRYLLIECKLVVISNPVDKLTEALELIGPQSYFKICFSLAKCHEEIAAKEANPIAILKPRNFQLGKQHLSLHLEEAILNYIKGVVKMQEDDPQLPEIYDKIVLCILLHGGIQYHVFVLFVLLRDHFSCLTQYNHLHVESDDSTFTNYFEIIDQFVKDSHAIIDDTWKPEPRNFLPLVFLTEDNELVVMEGIYRSFTTRQFKTTSLFYVIPEEKEYITSTPEMLESRITTSQKIANLCYNGYTNGFPVHLQSYYLQHINV